MTIRAAWNPPRCRSRAAGNGSSRRFTASGGPGRLVAHNDKQGPGYARATADGSRDAYRDLHARRAARRGRGRRRSGGRARQSFVDPSICCSGSGARWPEDSSPEDSQSARARAAARRAARRRRPIEQRLARVGREPDGLSTSRPARPSSCRIGEREGLGLAHHRIGVLAARKRIGSLVTRAWPGNIAGAPSRTPQHQPALKSFGSCSSRRARRATMVLGRVGLRARMPVPVARRYIEVPAQPMMSSAAAARAAQAQAGSADRRLIERYGDEQDRREGERGREQHEGLQLDSRPRGVRVGRASSAVR